MTPAWRLTAHASFLVAAASLPGCGSDFEVGTTPTSPPPQLDAASNDAASPTVPDADDPAIDALIQSRMNVAGVPGLVAVAVRGDRVLFAHGYGLANIAEGRAVTADTLFNVASISKTVVAAALMQLVERGKIALDDDVQPPLGFPARNPSFAGQAITSRMLLAHTSSLLDTAPVFGYLSYGVDSPITLADFMRGYVDPGGTYYRAGNWSASNAPGAAFSYSNAGSGLAGLLIEDLAGADLQTYCGANVFAPLGMTATSWFLAGIPVDEIAMPYTVDAAGQYAGAGYYTYPDYPSGQLRTSGAELARFLMMVIQGGTLGVATILSPASVTEMERKQLHSIEGLSWEYQTLDGHPLVGHWGVDVGVSTDMWFDPATGAGYIALTNGDVYRSNYANFESNGPYVAAVQAMIDIGTALLRLAEGT